MCIQSIVLSASNQDRNYLCFVQLIVLSLGNLQTSQHVLAVLQYSTATWAGSCPDGGMDTEDGVPGPHSVEGPGLISPTVLGTP